MGDSCRRCFRSVYKILFFSHEDLPSKLYPELLTTFYHDTAWDEDRTVFSFIRNTIIEIDIPKWVKLLINIGNITNTSKCTIDRRKTSFLIKKIKFCRSTVKITAIVIMWS